MGIKIPDPIVPPEPGDDCLGCYAAGKTPSWFTVTFTDIVGCPGWPAPPNNFPILVVQDPLNPCHYFANFAWGTGTWYCYFWLRVFVGGQWWSELGLNVVLPFAGNSFWHRLAPCLYDFENQNAPCPGPAGTEGTGHVFLFPPGIIIFLCTHAHFITQSHRLYEMQEVGMDHKLVRIATKRDATCCYFYIDSQEIPSFP